MCKIREIKHSNKLLDLIHLTSDRMSCKVFPNLGGSLQELTIDNIDIIDGITIDQKGLEDYQNSFKSSILFPFPNRIKDGVYLYGEQTYRLDRNDSVYDNAIHGLVYDRFFTFHKELNNTKEAKLELNYSSDGTFPGFPFSFGQMMIFCGIGALAGQEGRQ